MVKDLSIGCELYIDVVIILFLLRVYLCIYACYLYIYNLCRKMLLNFRVGLTIAIIFKSIFSA